MRRLISIGCLILVAFAPAATQSSVTGRWRAVLLTPDGGTQNISMELDAAGETVTGNVEGLAIREGRLDGSTLTLKLERAEQPGDLAYRAGERRRDRLQVHRPSAGSHSVRRAARHARRRQPEACRIRRSSSS